MVSTVAAATVAETGGWISWVAALAPVIAACLALWGATRSLRATVRLHEENSKEARKSARTERIFSAKKEALVPVARCAANLVNFLTTFPDRALPAVGSVPEVLTEFAETVSVIHFAASMDTIEKATAFSREFAVAFVEVAKARVAAELLGGEIVRLNSEIAEEEKFLSEQGQWLHSELNAAEELVVRRNISASQGHLIELRSQWNSKLAEKRSAIEACRDKAQEALPSLLRAQFRLLFQCRKDLARANDDEAFANDDEGRYFTLVEANVFEAQRVLRKLMLDLRTMAAEPAKLLPSK